MPEVVALEDRERATESAPPEHVGRLWGLAWASMALAGIVLATVDTAVVMLRADAGIGPRYFGMAVALSAWLGLGASGLLAIVARTAGVLRRRIPSHPAWRGLVWGVLLWGPAVLIARPWAVYDPYHMPWIMLGLAALLGIAGAVVQQRWPRWCLGLGLGGAAMIGLVDALAGHGHFARLHDVLAYTGVAVGTAGAWMARDRWIGRRSLWALGLLVVLAHGVLLGSVRPTTTTAAFYGTVAPKQLRLLHGLTDFDRDGFSGTFGGGDCDDGDPSRFPGACELAGNGVDDNCNARQDEPTPPRPAIPARPTKDTPQPDLYVLVIDTTRADWGGGGVPAALEPLRAQSLVFTRAYSPYPLTERAMTALAQGRHWRYVDGRTPTLLDSLLDAHYDVSIFHGTHRRREGLRSLFRRDDDTASLMRLEFKNKTTHTAPLIDEAIAELDQRPPGPVMRWLHLDDPHFPRTAGERSKSDRERYRLSVEYSAGEIARFLEALDRTERGRRAVVVLLGDHGEEFGEHGGRLHGATLYEESLRVPLWMRLPGHDARTEDAVVSLIDVFPTVAGVLGLALPAGIQGVDLLAGPPPPIRVVGQIDRVTARWSSSDRPTLRAVTDGRYKLIADIDRNVFLLFDLELDPGETRTVAHRQPQRTAALLERLAAWQDRPGCVPADR